ncbi:MAG: carboxypeptidase-like regulatory domain-containing protein [Variovorax sp.]
MNRLQWIAAACIAGALQAQAQTAGAMPPMKGEGAVRWVCGGIGVDESTAMRAAMKSHPLSLLFARKDGAYLAEIDVTIQRSDGGPTLALRADGPVCLIDLPAGRYTVQAVAGGATQKESVTVGGAPRTADFRF